MRLKFVYCIYISNNILSTIYILSFLVRLRFELQNYLSPRTRVRRASRIRDRERRRKFLKHRAKIF